MNWGRPLEAPFTMGQITLLSKAAEIQLGVCSKLGYRSRAADLREVQSCCTAVEDNLAGHEGFEDAHKELEDALAAVTCDSLFSSYDSLRRGTCPRIV